MTITKLEKDGMIQNSKVKKEWLMPERKIYRLTQKGKKQLAQMVERSLLDAELTNDLSNLGYFFIFGLSKEKAIECLKQRHAFLEKTMTNLRKMLDDFKGKTPLNRLIVIEKDIDRFKSEISNIKKLIKSIKAVSTWKASAFLRA